MDEQIPQIFETLVEKLVTGGAGLGRCEGVAAFIPLTAPGDRVRAEVVRRKKNFIEARLVEVLQPGPGRRPAGPEETDPEGGCVLAHLLPEAQRAAKRGILVDCFRRLGKLDVTELLQGPEAVGPETGYRNKIRLFAAATGRYGTLRPGSHEVVPLDRSALMPELFNERILPWLRLLPPVEQIVTRLDGRGGFLLQLYGQQNRLKVLKRMLKDSPGGRPELPECQGIVFNNLPVWGRDYLVMEIGGRKYRVGAKSFFQANLAVAEAVLETTGRWLAEARPAGGFLADLYCGVGLFSLALAGRFERVAASDSDPHAVRDARNNVERDADAHGKVTVLQGDCEAVLDRDDMATSAEWAGGCCIIDPPRAGLGARVTARLAQLGPRHVLYLSCDPATLARDAARLGEAGYLPRRLQAFDMFPRTAHLETLLLLERQEINKPG